MAVVATNQTFERLRQAARPLTGSQTDYDGLLEAVGDAHYVLLGEASHGTHEFYQARAELTKRLIQEKNFTVIAWEADWPDALRLNRYIQARSADGDRVGGAGGFQTLPELDVAECRRLGIYRVAARLQRERPAHASPVGVDGLDLYSLHTSIEAVVNYLDKMDPAAAAAARRRYSCFEQFGEDPQIYGMMAGPGDSLHSCEQQVVQQLLELQRKSTELLSRDGRIAEDELFFAKQNAMVAKDAEQYYRAMYRGRPNTWNLRDQHMVQTLDRLMEHLAAQGERPKAVVWAHNSHLGDARATSMGGRGEWNVGQLLREWHEEEALLVGFTTFTGTVTAASDWGAPAERKWVRPGLEGSYERFFHEADLGNFLLRLNAPPNARVVPAELLERAIGVIYLPETERMSHYFFCRLAEQFDVVIHFDETRAVAPLERTSEWEAGELPETYPTAL